VTTVTALAEEGRGLSFWRTRICFFCKVKSSSYIHTYEIHLTTTQSPPHIYILRAYAAHMKPANLALSMTRST
jgi:hypothetical protein